MANHINWGPHNCPRVNSFFLGPRTSPVTVPIMSPNWDMGWLRLVGSLKLLVSFAEYRLFYRALLQKTWDTPIRVVLVLQTRYIYIYVYIYVHICIYKYIYMYTHIYYVNWPDILDLESSLCVKTDIYICIYIIVFRRIFGQICVVFDSNPFKSTIWSNYKGLPDYPHPILLAGINCDTDRREYTVTLTNCWSRIHFFQKFNSESWIRWETGVRRRSWPLKRASLCITRRKNLAKPLILKGLSGCREKKRPRILKFKGLIRV